MDRELSDQVIRKYQQRYYVSDYQVWTDEGWKDIDQVSKTVPYQKWTVQTQSGKKLEGADNHILFRQNYQQVFLKQLNIGDVIITQDGNQRIVRVSDDCIQQNMYDISVNSEGHRFFSNGILSHNSTSYSIYALWYCLVNKDKSILICANKQKTSVQILSRIKMAYQMLPNWLKPGIITWNKMCVQFSNGCKVTAQATSQSSGRGRIN